MQAISLAYHDVADGTTAAGSDVRPAAAFYTLSRRSFQEHLRSIAGHRSSVDLISGFGLWRNRLPAFLTFDDGAANACCAADELERQGWRGHFFVTTNWIGRPGFLNGQQIRELYKRGHVIGSHSCSHPARMSHLPWNELCREWSDSCATLGGILGDPVKVASVPDGYYSDVVAQTAAEAGLEVLFTSEATSASHVVDGCLILGRYLVHWYTSAEEAGAIAAGHVWPRCKQALSWESKKVLKSLMGEHYFSARKRLLKLGPQPNTKTAGKASPLIDA
jgi:peptidoglycan/xylan/chitin deacetylase (PgdA/CDA1 family)